MQAVVAIAGDSVVSQKIGSDIVKIAQKMEQLGQEKIVQTVAQELMSAEKIGIAATEGKIVTRSIAEILTDIQKFDGKISLSNVLMQATSVL